MKNASRTAVGAVAVCLPLVAAATVLPASAASPPAPSVEILTPVRSSFPDDVSIRFEVEHDDDGMRVVELEGPSHVAVARITVQPGSRFPLHTHPGPVVVSVIAGQLTYVDLEDCDRRVYPAGTAFVDTGDDVHTAFGSGQVETVLVATFFGAPKQGPLTVPVPDQGQDVCP